MFAIAIINTAAGNLSIFSLRANFTRVQYDVDDVAFAVILK